ncbi:MAG: DNRLRE domain-containing protein [Microthrixaceae bacterium]|nr:DNRLRE domain-containing protein [Microthrixaceae bacterium]
MLYRLTNNFAARKAEYRRNQDGFSLIETLVASVIFSMVGAAILAGVAMVIRTDADQQARSAASVASQNYSDVLLSAPYVACAPTSAYTPAALSLSNQDKATISVESVAYWTGQPLPTVANPTAAQWATAFGASCTTDKGLQRVTYKVNSQVGERTAVKTVSVVKRFTDPHTEPVPDPPPGGRMCVISGQNAALPKRVESTWVNEFAGSQGTNYSTGSSSQEMNMLYLAGSRRFSYVRFNVAPNVDCDNGGTLPASANIIAAEVRLFTFNIGGLPACGANSCWHVMERVRANWSESTINWSNQPCPHAVGVDYGKSCQAGNVASTILFEHGTGAFNWSARYQRVQSTQLLNDVKSFYTSPATNYGWVIKEACAETYGKACGSISPGFQMRSSRSTNVDQRPTLTVWY